MTHRHDPPPPAAAGPRASDPDRAVDEEWRAIEAARIAEERAEAAADLVEAAREPAARRRWPWLAIVFALAAGLLMTLVLNRPPIRQLGAEGQRAGEEPAPAVSDQDETRGAATEP